MFGIFKNKKSDQHYNKLVEYVSVLVQMQFKQSACDDGPSVASRDLWSLGYILGFHDAFCQNQNISDKNKRIQFIKDSYEIIFRDLEDSFEPVLVSLHMQNESTFRSGVIAGGTEAMGLINGTIPMPLGLAMRITDINSESED